MQEVINVHISKKNYSETMGSKKSLFYTNIADLKKRNVKHGVVDHILRTAPFRHNQQPSEADTSELQFLLRRILNCVCLFCR